MTSLMISQAYKIIYKINQNRTIIGLKNVVADKANRSNWFLTNEWKLHLHYVPVFLEDTINVILHQWDVSYDEKMGEQWV